MDLANLQHHWEALGGKDPLWAVLSQKGKQDGRWNPDEFFQTGESYMTHLVRCLESLDMPSSFGSALDFGCGVGRMSQAICRHAKSVVGVDIARTMVEEARKYNKHGDRCRYEVNTRDDLSMFSDGQFDLVHSTLVLQHMHPSLQRRYLRELMRVLAPGGVGLLQIASDYIDPDPGPHDARTVASGPLPETSSRARLVTVAKHKLGIWELDTLGVSVTNLGDGTWPGKGDDEGRFQVKLGSRWRDADGRVVLEDQRTALTADVLPGASAEMSLRIAAPETSGSYRLEVDMIQEGVGWFAERGSEPAIIKLDVFEQASASGDTPVIEMYCIPRPAVLALCRSAGVTFSSSKELPSSGSKLVRHQYWLKK